MVITNDRADVLPQVDMLAENRQQFVNSLLQCELITQAFVETGALEQFNIDQKTGVDALSHILVGDLTGGFHHLPTATALELTRSVGSWVLNPDASMKSVPWHEQYANLREKQSVRRSGVYYAKYVGIGTGEIDPGTGYEKTRTKSGGSNMFPDTWNTQQVLSAIIETVDRGLSRLAKEGDRYIYNHIIGDVPIQVMTRASDGKIIAAYPMKVA